MGQFFSDETPFEGFFHALTRLGLERFGRYYGFYRGRVEETFDDEAGGILVVVPRICDDPIPAQPIAPWARKGSGWFFGPEVGDLVLVMFEDGDARRPYYVGGWYVQDGLPVDLRKAGRAGYTIRGIVTKLGLKLLFDETDAEPAVRIETPGGVKAKLDKVVTLETSDGAKIVLDGDKAYVSAPGGTFLGASATDPVLTLSKMNAYLTSKLKVASPFGPIGPAVVPMDAADAAQNVKAS